MSSYLVPLLIIGAAVGMLLFVLGRRFRQITLLDVENLPEVKAAIKKDDFLRKRAEQAAEKKSAAALRNRRSFLQRFRGVARFSHRLVEHIERKLSARTNRPARPLTSEEHQEVRSLLYDAGHALENGLFDVAEKKYIAAIKIDERNKESYQGLADVYYRQGHFDEAKQTYRFVLYLDPQHEGALLRLAEIAESEGKLESAVEYYQQVVLLNDNLSSRFAKLYDLLIQLGQPATALEAIRQARLLEPQNPKYLDNFIEASILVGNKNLAEEGYRDLRLVNPENQKLPLFRGRIDAMTTY